MVVNMHNSLSGKITHSNHLINKFNFLILTLAFILIGFFFGAKVQAAEITPPPVGSHPRLFVTADDISEIRKRTTREEMQTTFGAWQRFSNWNGSFSLDSSKDNNYNETYLIYIKAKAFMHMSGLGGADMGAAAVDAMTEYLKNLKIPDTHTTFVRRAKGEVIFTIALVYDWCYDIVKEKGKEAELMEAALALADDNNLAVSYSKDSGVNMLHRSYVESQTGEYAIFRDLLSLSIAIYDELPDMYEAVAATIINDMAPSRILSSKAGAHFGGSSYGAMRYSCEALAVWMFDAIGIEDIFGKDFADISYQWIYDRRPDGIFMKNGDDYTASQYSPISYPRLTMDALLFGACKKGDVALKRAWIRCFASSESVSNQNLGNLYTLLFAPDISDMDLENENPLPLSKKYNYPLSAITARTNWQSGPNAATAMVRMNMHNVNTAGHMHQDSGSFEIYYKGPLAVDAGIYEGENGAWAGDYHLNFAQRSIAHNLVRVFDPDEKYLYGAKGTEAREYFNDGGQRRPTIYSTVETVDELISSAACAEETSFYIGPDKDIPAFSYIKGDLSKSYSDKVEKYERQMVFLNMFDEKYPAAFIVLDKLVSSNAEFKKTWTLNTAEKPIADGNKISLTNDNVGYGGKLISTALLPAGATVQIIKETNPQLINKADGSYDDLDYHRVEINNVNNEKQTVFLNAMLVTDSENNEELEPQLFEGQRHWSVMLGDRMVFFSKDGVISDSFSINIPGDKKAFILLTDIASGAWKLVGRDTDINIEAKADEKSLALYLMPGEYTLSPNKGALIDTRSFPKGKVSTAGDFDIFLDKAYYIGDRPNIKNENGLFIALNNMKLFGIELSKNKNSYTLSFKNRSMEISPADEEALLNGAIYKLKTAPFIQNDSVYINIVDLNVLLGTDYNYDSLTQILHAYSSEEVGNTISDILRPRDVEYSDYSEMYSAAFAYDNNINTRYRAESRNSRLIYDLGAISELKDVHIKFYDPFGERNYYYKIELSSDGISYTSFYEGASENQSDITIPLNGAEARYVSLSGRMNGTDPISVYEFAVSGKRKGEYNYFSGLSLDNEGFLNGRLSMTKAAIAAIYNADNSLYSVNKLKRGNISSKENIQLLDGQYIKLFVWDELFPMQKVIPITKE